MSKCDESDSILQSKYKSRNLKLKKADNRVLDEFRSNQKNERKLVSLRPK